MKARTKDERFIITLYEALANAEDFSSPMDRYEIGNRIGIHPKGVDTICKQLIRANFIKKISDNEIILTPQGKRLIEDIKANHG